MYLKISYAVRIICAVIVVVFLIKSETLRAQPSYNSGMGLSAGTFFGASYKTFPAKHFAWHINIGLKLNAVSDLNFFWNFELNPNVAFQNNIGNKGLYWFLGGGLSIGYAFFPSAGSKGKNVDGGKAGANAIVGLEYIFPSTPIALQFDIRPGYGMLIYRTLKDSFGFRQEKGSLEHFLDWSVSVTIRYTLKVEPYNKE